MRRPILVGSLACSILGCGVHTVVQAGESASPANIVYAEVASFAIPFVVPAANSLSLNYERRVWGSYWIRAGYGIAIAVEHDDALHGPTLMVNRLGRGRHMLELGGGLSVMTGYNGDVPQFFRAKDDLSVFPALAVAYRYQRPEGGFMWRLGLSWVYGFGLPGAVGAGWAF